MIDGKALVGGRAQKGASATHRTDRRKTMMDEMWMRNWNSGHGALCADLDRCFAGIAGAVSRLRLRRDLRDRNLRSRIGVPTP
jgi:hypothetical protein